MASKHHQLLFPDSKKKVHIRLSTFLFCNVYPTETCHAELQNFELQKVLYLREEEEVILLLFLGSVKLKNIAFESDVYNAFLIMFGANASIS